MNQLSRNVKADSLKLAKTPFFLLHLFIPLLGIVIFLSYQLMTDYQSDLLTINYFQVLTLSYPIIAAWLTTIVIDQEIEAGGGFFLLNVPTKHLALTVKILLLITGGLFSCLIVGGGYHLLIDQLRLDYSLSSRLILLLIGVVWSCSLFQYFFHLWLGLCFGRNVNFSIAAVELLLSALLLTGLGETIWFFFPCSWGARLVPLLADFFKSNNTEALTKIKMGGISLIILTVSMLVFLFIWFRKWEGRNNEA